ncbi:hypothetical protein OIN60_22080 [Paenibacillus sp. P96]|uniref:Uncharacterized protein n=1 Tax=Paenibacillus zeirhizosphaerae TaxID=2987519 RepID=A0ABT9FXF1_9BACL|nr:hypothetical protein [Paenibacillus sp. P96]MDP4099409.1 hypothetical protein [Paenibacillus sp. P96]
MGTFEKWHPIAEFEKEAILDASQQTLSRIKDLEGSCAGWPTEFLQAVSHLSVATAEMLECAKADIVVNNKMEQLDDLITQIIGVTFSSMPSQAPPAESLAGPVLPAMWEPLSDLALAGVVVGISEPVGEWLEAALDELVNTQLDVPVQSQSAASEPACDQTEELLEEPQEDQQEDPLEEQLEGQTEDPVIDQDQTSPPVVELADDPMSEPVAAAAIDAVAGPAIDTATIDSIAAQAEAAAVDAVADQTAVQATVQANVHTAAQTVNPADTLSTLAASESIRVVVQPVINKPSAPPLILPARSEHAGDPTSPKAKQPLKSKKEPSKLPVQVSAKSVKLYRKDDKNTVHSQKLSSSPPERRIAPGEGSARRNEYENEKGIVCSPNLRISFK